MKKCSAAVYLVIAVWSSMGFAQDGDPGEARAPVPSGWKILSETEVERPIDGAVMVWVAGGEFLRGSPAGEGSVNEHPQRRIWVDGFWIDKCEVTWGQYESFCQATGHVRPERLDSHGNDQPVNDVTWDDALAYAAWVGCRLPTEAEWEKAARGTDGRRYPWGNDEPDGTRANFDGSSDGFEFTSPVGRFPSGRSPYGALDMAGNVWEWCSDWHEDDYYAEAAERNPTGPGAGSLRVLRGGGRVDHPSKLRAALRGGGSPGLSHGDLGFRTALR